MALSPKQKKILFVGGIVTITMVAVLLAKSGKFGTSAKQAIDKVDSKLSSVSAPATASTSTQ